MEPLQLIIYTAFYLGLYFVTFWLLTFLEKGVLTTEKHLTHFPLVTVAIPAYNEEGNIARSIHSVLNLAYPPEKLQILVINDGSKDNTSNIVKDLIKKNQDRNIQLLEQQNSGKGAALNNALSHATGEYFVCLDADSEAEHDNLKKMLPHFDQEDVAVVLPLMKVRTPTTVLQKLQWCEYLLNFFYKSLMAAINCVHVAPGPFSVYKKKVLQDVGGFATNNLTEDFEITLKIQKRHYKIIQLLNATVYTGTPDTFNAFCKQRNRWYKGTLLNLFDYKNMIFNKKYGDFGMLQLPRVLLSGFLAVSFISLTGWRFVVKPLLKRIDNWSSINFDLLVFLQRLHFDLSWIDLSYTNLFFGIISLTLALIIINYAYHYTREKVFRYGFISVPIYILAYGLLASTVWITVFIDLLRGKRQRW
ncbi:MAG TPA: glycosyltransferase [Candidatus Nanoarchaeia archaeon]|nr:glycosyltransferase [Candidatus Nanoarchaeia archaeon]